MPNYIAMSDAELDAEIALIGGTTVSSWNGATAEYNRRAQDRLAQATATAARQLVVITVVLAFATLGLVWTSVFEETAFYAKLAVAVGATAVVGFAMSRL